MINEKNLSIGGEIDLKSWIPGAGLIVRRHVVDWVNIPNLQNMKQYCPLDIFTNVHFEDFNMIQVL